MREHEPFLVVDGFVIASGFIDLTPGKPREYIQGPFWWADEHELAAQYSRHGMPYCKFELASSGLAPQMGHLTKKAAPAAIDRVIARLEAQDISAQTSRPTGPGVGRRI